MTDLTRLLFKRPRIDSMVTERQTSQAPKGITPDKARAYRATDFVVFLDGGPLVLNVGKGSPRLADLLADFDAESCAFITAYNPHGGDPPPALWENEERQRALIQEVEACWKVVPGAGRDPTGAWPAEPSVLVVGISLAKARALSARYGQDAFVFGNADGRVELVATDSENQGTLDSAQQ